MKILIVDDERNIRESIQRLFSLEGVESFTAEDGRAAMALLLSEAFDAAVIDLKMPVMGGQELLEWMRAEGLRTPVVIISAFGEIADAVRALKAGADDYLIKPFDPDELIHRVKGLVAGRKREDLIEAGTRTQAALSRLVGESPVMRALKDLIDKVAATATTVLITGESGTGKEVVARELHARSGRGAEPFVAVNIGAVHAELMESELFGHEKGSFTGAESRKLGLFELAGGGTLFLDEIGEMPLPLQVKLLRVLQERKIRRLGGQRDIPIDSRIVSATNRDIEALVREGKFREDLYYRLNVVRIDVPPLRDRLSDLPALASHILARQRGRAGRGPLGLSREALSVLGGYDFPGNIRELENLLERAAIYCEGPEIQASDVDLPRRRRSMAQVLGGGGEGGEDPPAAAAASPDPDAAASDPPPLDGGEASLRLTDAEVAAIIRALKKCKGNRTKTALELGISRRALLYKIKRYGLK
jgi:two-component system response regulator AtoC